MNKKFTNDEILLLSQGLLALIKNVSEANKLVYDNKSHEALCEEIETYKELNIKIINMLNKDGD